MRRVSDGRMWFRTYLICSGHISHSPAVYRQILCERPTPRRTQIDFCFCLALSVLQVTGGRGTAMWRLSCAQRKVCFTTLHFCWTGG